jgi:NADPH-dependent 2,4-dienoyl-CoA reductase/sulfur reductase-like enzyme
VQRVVIVGAGLAGFETVVALRTQGYDGRLTMIGAERHPPYDRPPLSKAVLQGHQDDPTLDADWPALDVELRLGVAATRLTPGHLTTTEGPVGFDQLVIATGSQPIQLPGADSALTLRTLEDSLRLRMAFQPGAHVVVVGAGWIGAEVATAAAAAGCRTTVVEALAQPLAAALPAEIGRFTAPWYAEAGTELRLGARVTAVEPDAVHLDDGERLRADVVLVGIGVRPSTGWLRDSGIALTPSGAVEVDAQLFSNLPGVLAVGDCAAWTSQRYGTRLHVEHWDNALHAPAVAASTLAGGDASYDPVPYFWSEQWGRMVQYAGHHAAADRTVARGNPEQDRSWSMFWLTGDRLVAALAVDRHRDLVQARRLIAHGGEVDVDRLADPAIPVKLVAA